MDSAGVVEKMFELDPRKMEEIGKHSDMGLGLTPC